MSGRHMNARPKRLTRKQKEAFLHMAGIPGSTFSFRTARMPAAGF